MCFFMIHTTTSFLFFFFFNDTATTEIYTLSLHDALPISIATALGVGLGLLIGWFPFAEDILFPPIELLRPIPAVAWVPLSIMLWPTERSSIVFITSLGAFFPIVLNTIHGVEGIDRQLVRAATSLGAGRAAIFREVVIPGALPSIVTGLSVGMGVSWICLIS